MEDTFRLEQVSVRLVKDTPLLSQESIGSPEDAIRILAEAFGDYDREVVGIVNLNAKGKPINMSVCSMGTLTESLIHPRDLVKASILSNASSILMFHTHPSGILEPSREDIRTTSRMQQVCTLIDIPLLDHIILGNDLQYFSFMEKKILPVSKLELTQSLEELDFKPVKKSIKKSLSEKKTQLAREKKPLRKNREKTEELL